MIYSQSERLLLSNKKQTNCTCQCWTIASILYTGIHTYLCADKKFSKKLQLMEMPTINIRRKISNEIWQSFSPVAIIQHSFLKLRLIDRPSRKRKREQTRKKIEIPARSTVCRGTTNSSTSLLIPPHQ